MSKHYSIPLCLIFLLVIFAPSAVAQGVGPAGTFTLNRQVSDDVNQAIDAAVSRLTFVTRPTMRGKLRRENTAYQRVLISHAGGNFSIKFDQRPPMNSPDNGQPVKWTREDGKKFDLSTELRGGSLVQTARAEDGSTARTFTPSGDGQTLTLEVV